jgi:hypothetical protein
MAPNQRSLAGKENCASVFCPHVHALARPFLNRHALYYATPPRGKTLTSSSSNVLFKHQYLKWLGWHHPCAAATNYSPCQFPTHTHTHTHTHSGQAILLSHHTSLHFITVVGKVQQMKRRNLCFSPKPWWVNENSHEVAQVLIKLPYTKREWCCAMKKIGIRSCLRVSFLVGHSSTKF